MVPFMVLICRFSEGEDGDELEELAPKQYRTDFNTKDSYQKRRRTKSK